MRAICVFAALVLVLATVGRTVGARQVAMPGPVAECPEMAKALQDVLRNDARQRDWPQLARYREHTADLQRAATKVDVVFLGDSITDAWDNEGYGGFFPGKSYVNRGIGGQTTPQMLVRLRPDVLSLKPKVVVLLAGTNDIAGNTGPVTDADIEQNIAAISELAAAHGVRMVLASILPISNYHVRPETGPAQTTRRPMPRILALNAWIRKYAAEHGHVFLDYVPAVADEKGLLRADLSEDDLHPNAKGYALMAPLAEHAIAKALAK
jgi:lysophospholipase L1-like esterase